MSLWRHQAPLVHSPGQATRGMIARSIGVLFSGSIASRLFAAVSLIVMARSVGPTAFGQFVATITIVRLLSLLISLGMDQWLLRNGGQSQTQAALTTTTIATLKLLLGMPWLIALFVLLPRINPALFTTETVIWVGLIVWCEELINTLIVGYQSTLNVRLASLLTVTPQALILLGTVLIALYTQALSTNLVMRSATMIGCTILAGALWGWRAQFQMRHHIFLPIIIASLPFALSNFLVMLYGTADIILVGQLLGSEAAGIYAPASNLIGLLYLAPGAYFAVMVPVLSRAADAASPGLPRAMSVYVGVSLLLGALLAAGMMLVAPLFIQIAYGAAYATTTALLPPLSVVVWLHTVSFSLAAILTALNLQKQRLIPQTAAAVINIGLNLALLQPYGLIAVAWSFVASEIILVAGYWLLYRRAGAQLAHRTQAIDL